jgi:ABC-type branched-subunit amino acid transport system permease subunit
LEEDAEEGFERPPVHSLAGSGHLQGAAPPPVEKGAFVEVFPRADAATRGEVAVVLFIVAGTVVPNFFQLQNLINLLTNNWFIIIIGIGVTFLLITGNFDMSVGGIIAMTGVLSVYFCQGAHVSKNPLANGLGLPYGVAIALPTLRLKGIFLALITIGFQEIVFLVTLNWTSLTRGPMGVPGIPPPAFICRFASSYCGLSGSVG